MEEQTEKTPEEIKNSEEENKEANTALTAALKKELKDREEFKGIKDVSDLALKYLDVLSNKTSESIPDTPDGYELKLEGELEQKAKVLNNEEGRKAFGEVLKSIGISKSKGSKIYGLVLSSMVGMEESRIKAMAAARQKAEEELKKEVGDKYKEVTTGVINVLKNVSDDGFVKWLDESGEGSDPRFIKTMYKLINMPSEDRLEVSTEEAPPKKREFTFTNTPK